MNITQQRKIAKERIVEQFSESLKSAGLLVVDCGDVGTAVVTSDPAIGGPFFGIQWVERDQIKTLAGRLES